MALQVLAGARYTTLTGILECSSMKDYTTSPRRLSPVQWRAGNHVATSVPLALIREGRRRNQRRQTRMTTIGHSSARGSGEKDSISPSVATCFLETKSYQHLVLHQAGHHWICRLIYCKYDTSAHLLNRSCEHQYRRHFRPLVVRATHN
jgi:hypothetical protein